MKEIVRGIGLPKRNGGYKLYLTNSDGKYVATKAHANAEPKPGETLSVKVDDFYGEKE